MKVNFDFICSYEGGECRPSEETAEARRVSRAEGLRYITSPARIYRFRNMLEFDGRIAYAAYVSSPVFALKTERRI